MEDLIEAAISHGFQFEINEGVFSLVIIYGRQGKIDKLEKLACKDLSDAYEKMGY